ncbi:hypothetical protein AVEN_24325-1 [Araneus ventricosus]|uniref:Uncharacterized protein n=1 Tax=Araneus ventricosus TaxID=182803 RepID=A0A4Y2NG36_ARAVE|nr:hypothetical protein AVEN_24325-1 [Araneus ventricosus]
MGHKKHGPGSTSTSYPLSRMMLLEFTRGQGNRLSSRGGWQGLGRPSVIGNLYLDLKLVLVAFTGLDFLLTRPAAQRNLMRRPSKFRQILILFTS